MAFELFCMTIIALLFASALIFGGYRFFLFLLPIWVGGWMRSISSTPIALSSPVLSLITPNSWAMIASPLGARKRASCAPVDRLS